MRNDQSSNLFVSQQPRARTITGVMVLLGMGLVILAHALRPIPPETHPLIVLLLGTLPNVGAGLGLPFLIMAFEPVLQQRAIRPARIPFGIVCLFVLGALIAWEYISWWVWGISIDPYDLLASGVGVGVAALVYALVGVQGTFFYKEEKYN